ncbi:LysE family translocator [Deinococcus cellulosilyticus]|uniref:RhtB family transporter n=1 Tax=Deinococcus cellulosilyticus (strain DSM 18568 / NBRC 106333 / KACC 11606 / 5516J-15) TaxID=1223518 RepID=A0A511MWQ4_DEIC1|nr:LysE family translocator [Deinococcus cellulosilyticus]GEM44990.1 RhtB family transporter [Deinococcus cellulosilyticus NBRC 106333 = KACC 11606]
MIEPATLLIFIVSALALLAIPGPSVLYIVARSVQQGRQAGLVSALGVGVGSLVHIFAAAAGLSALLLSSALAFTVVKVLGAAYLVYLGIRTMLERANPQDDTQVPPQALAKVFTQGIIVNALNPKTALFFLAFLPQFVHPQAGPVLIQILLLGAVFVVLGVLSDSMYALLGGWLARRLRQNQTFMRRQKYLTGGVYLALGAVTVGIRESH